MSNALAREIFLATGLVALLLGSMFLSTGTNRRDRPRRSSSGNQSRKEGYSHICRGYRSTE